MSNIQGVIAGISIDKSNEIKPSFDAMIYNFVIGQDGHALAFSTSGTTLTVNGFAVANGIRGFFENAQITIATNGYLYVLFTTHQSASVADTVELEWSATALTETHDNIGSVAGIYRMKVLTVSSGTATVNNKIECVAAAETAENVTETLAEGVTGTTPATTDNSTKVATTEFVNAAILAKYTTFDTTQFSLSFTASSTTTNSITKQGKSVICNFKAVAGSGTYIPTGNTVLTIPEGYRPAAQLTIPAAAATLGIIRINTDGTVITNGYFTAEEELSFNAGYVIP